MGGGVTESLTVRNFGEDVVVSFDRTYDGSMQ